MARIVRGDDAGNEESSRRRRRETSSTHPTYAGLRVLVPVLTHEHERIIGRLQAAGAVPCPLFHTDVRKLQQSQEDTGAAYSARIDTDEVFSAARVLQATAVLVVHLTAALRSRLETLAPATSLQVIDKDHPLASRIAAG